MARMYHHNYSIVHLLSESLSFRFISAICFGRYIISSVHIFSQLVVFLESYKSLTYSPIILLLLSHSTPGTEYSVDYKLDLRRARLLTAK